MSTEIKVIGLYGVSGCGRSYFLQQIKDDSNAYSYFEGSEVISTLVPGGLDRFKELDAHQQTAIREKAVRSIHTQAQHAGKHAVITGHYSFWNSDTGHLVPIITKADLQIYTHVIYLSPSAETVQNYRRNDATRTRPSLSVESIRQWQNGEKQGLRACARENGILLTVVKPWPDAIRHVTSLMHHFTTHTPELNQERAEAALDLAMGSDNITHSTVVLDADKTLAPFDAGTLYWSRMSELCSAFPRTILSELFKSRFGYSYEGFKQAMLLYEEAAMVVDYDTLTEAIAGEIKLYSEMMAFLERLSEMSGVKVIVLTCGIKHVWQMVLDRLGLASSIHVIGGCRLQDGFVVTPQVKGLLTSRLKDKHKQHVIAIGDSPVDLEMLKQADQAYVIAGDESIRSKTMPHALRKTMTADSLKISQILLPPTAKAMFDQASCPITTLLELKIPHTTPMSNGVHATCQLRHLTDTAAAKLLMTPTRDSQCSGPILRRAHKAIGIYLAQTLVPEVLGLDTYDVPHVQGNTTQGYRCRAEHKVTIVAMMRGGEPMAQGVNEVLSSAMFLHAKQPDDIQSCHVGGQDTVLLVDAVVNTGRSVVEMMARIRALSSTARICVVAAVVQKDCLSGALAMLDVDVLALRISDNKYKGSGVTDTGNRLFNTTHLA